MVAQQNVHRTNTAMLNSYLHALNIGGNHQWSAISLSKAKHIHIENLHYQRSRQEENVPLKLGSKTQKIQRMQEMFTACHYWLLNMESNCHYMIVIYIKNGSKWAQVTSYLEL